MKPLIFRPELSRDTSACEIFIFFLFWLLVQELIKWLCRDVKKFKFLKKQQQKSRKRLVLIFFHIFAEVGFKTFLT